MSWHFSQAMEEASSAAHSSDGAPFAPWKSIPTAPDDSCSGKMKGTFHRSPFGTMFVPSTDAHGEAVLTSYLEAFPVRTFPPPAREPASKENAPASGKNSPASFAKWAPDSSSWKTHQCSLFGGLEPFSETWPRWGMMRNGESSEQKIPSGLLAIRQSITSESVSGFVQRCPTPTASMMTTADMEQAKFSGSDKRRPTYQEAKAKSERVPTPNSRDWKDSGPTQGNRNSPNLGTVVQCQRFQTPTCQDANGRTYHNQKNGTKTPSLLGQVQCLRFPPPKAKIHEDCPSERKRKSPSLECVVRFATPQARDFRTGEQSRWESPDRSRNLNDPIGGQLNPTWVEWLMGWPLGWTASKPLETDKFQQWSHSHGIFSPDSLAKALPRD